MSQRPVNQVDTVPLWGVFGVAFAVYAVMGAPGVEWMDAGELTAAAFGLGGAHPPGHPAHTLLGKLACLVPVGEVAFRVNLLSAAGMAAAVAGVAALARALVAEGAAGWVASIAAAGLAAASPLATTNATRAEVYGPVAALVVWSAVGCVRFARGGGNGARAGAGPALAAALGLALAAAMHPLIAAAAGLPLAIGVAVAARGRLRRLAAPAAALALLGLAAYLYLPVRANAAAAPPMWGDPSTPERLWALLTGVAYQGNFSLDGIGGRLAEIWMLVGEGSGLAILLGGLVGLGFGAVTRLPGAGLLLAAAAAVVAGAAGQRHHNPDMPGYVLPALLLLAAGLAPLAAAIVRALPAELAAGPRRRALASAIALAPVCGLALAGPVSRADDGGARRADDALRLWDDTVARVPPGPAVYFANADHTLFPAWYERRVAGARPDVALANAELARDIWFLEQLDRALPELYVPYVNDGARDAPAARLVALNLRAGRYAGGDVAAFGPLLASHAAPRGRAFRYALQPVDSDPDEAIPPPPADYRGAVGRRVAGRVALERARYEANRGRLDRAARAAGLASRFGDAGMQALAAAPAGRPALYDHLPAITRAFLFAEWQRQTLGDDLAWRAGLPAAPLPGDAPVERRLLAAWHDLLDGRAGARERLGGFDRGAQLATARMLVAVGRDELAEQVLRARVDADRRDAAALVLLGSLAGNRGRLDEAEALFRRALELEPDSADVWARLGVALARQGRVDEARQAWQQALYLDPSRADVASWLRTPAAGATN